MRVRLNFTFNVYCLSRYGNFNIDPPTRYSTIFFLLISSIVKQLVYLVFCFKLALPVYRNFTVTDLNYGGCAGLQVVPAQKITTLTVVILCL